MEIVLDMVIALYRTSRFLVNVPVRVLEAWYSIRVWHQLKFARLPRAKKRTAERLAIQHTQQLSPFLQLPIELRLRIYQLALHHHGKWSVSGGGCVLQPAVGPKGMYLSTYAPYSSAWSPGQCIRSDEDPLHSKVPFMLALGASARQPIVGPPSRGCVHYSIPPTMIYGDGPASWAWLDYHTIPPEETCEPATLLRVCKAMYHDVLPLLYSYNTITLFGAEMVPFFSRNASPDGVKSIRNLHLLLRLDAAQWAKRTKKQRLLATIRCLKQGFTGLLRLDVDVIVAWGQPSDGRMLWDWLRQELFSSLEGLEQFVLKVTVLMPIEKPVKERHGPDWYPVTETLESTNEDEYQRLKLAVTGVRT